MNKTQAISKMILDKMHSVASVNGLAFNDRQAVKAAIDHVLGEGAYDRLVSELYDEFNARAAR